MEPRIRSFHADPKNWDVINKERFSEWCLKYVIAVFYAIPKNIDGEISPS